MTSADHLLLRYVTSELPEKKKEWARRPTYPTVFGVYVALQVPTKNHLASDP